MIDVKVIWLIPKKVLPLHRHSNFTGMDILVQKSVKLSPHIIAELQRISKEKIYWKFNAVVNQFLAVMVDGLDEQEVNNVFRYSHTNIGKRPVVHIEWVDK